MCTIWAKQAPSTYTVYASLSHPSRFNLYGRTLICLYIILHTLCSMGEPSIYTNYAMRFDSHRLQHTRPTPIIRRYIQSDPFDPSHEQDVRHVWTNPLHTGREPASGGGAAGAGTSAPLARLEMLVPALQALRMHVQNNKSRPANLPLFRPHSPAPCPRSHGAGTERGRARAAAVTGAHPPPRDTPRPAAPAPHGTQTRTRTHQPRGRGRGQ